MTIHEVHLKVLGGASPDSELDPSYPSVPDYTIGSHITSKLTGPRRPPHVLFKTAEIKLAAWVER